MSFVSLFTAAVSLLACCSVVLASKKHYDVCVYTGNAAGVMAAVAAAKQGSKVVLIEPSRWLGGMVGGGIYTTHSMVDWGNKFAVGGLTLDILENDHDNPGFRDLFKRMIKEHKNIDVIYSHRVSKVNGGHTITSIDLDYAPFDSYGCPPEEAEKGHAEEIFAKVFIDCSYDGQLMAESGVSYTYGRESADKFGESLAGAQKHSEVYDIDPYKIPGKNSSGLIPLVQPLSVTNSDPKGADKLTMAYAFRWSFSRHGWPIEPSGDYDANKFELFRRAFKANVDPLQESEMVHKYGKMKTDENQINWSIFHINTMHSLESQVVFGSNMEFPDGTYAKKAKIWKDYQNYFRDLTHFLRTDPSVPPEQKQAAGEFRLARGQFDDTMGYPHQLYIREARRMQSTYIITEKDLHGNIDQPDSVGLASYGIDEFPYAIVATPDGKVAVHGGYFSVVELKYPEKPIYQIPYRAIVPNKHECTNLIVPVAISSSHIAYTSLRMEPVFMTLGQSAGIAASIAVSLGVSVQDVPYDQLSKVFSDERVKTVKSKKNI